MENRLNAIEKVFEILVIFGLEGAAVLTAALDIARRFVTGNATESDRQAHYTTILGVLTNIEHRPGTRLMLAVRAVYLALCIYATDEANDSINHILIMAKKIESEHKNFDPDLVSRNNKKRIVF